MGIKKIGIIGLGLIGGSMAKTIRLRMPDIAIYAADVNEHSLNEALAEHVIAKAFPIRPDMPCEIDADFFSCDCIILCAEVQNNVALLGRIKSGIKHNTILTDVGSVKENVSNEIRKAGLCPHFIGGHPMAGSEKSGYENATPYLIENAYYLLTPEPEVPKEMVKDFINFLQKLQVLPLVLSAQYHDYSTAAVSHFPHILAAGLVNMVKDLDDKDETMKHIAAGGFKDITRIASSSPEMWRQVCLTNKKQIIKMLSVFQKQLGQIEQLLLAEDAEHIYRFFESAKEYRDSMRITSNGSILRTYHLYCDLIDETGGIATIATILASNNISIKNIGIIHNREFEDGVLQIEFYAEDAFTHAVTLLRKYHYTVYER